MHASIDPTSHLLITWRLPDGRHGHHRVGNRLTNHGREAIALLFGGGWRIDAVHLHVGSGGADTDPTRNELEQPLGEFPVALKAPELGELEGVPRARIPAQALLPVREEGPDQSLREAGLMLSLKEIAGDAGSTRTMLYNRVVFDIITRSPELEMSFAWDVWF